MRKWIIVLAVLIFVSSCYRPSDEGPFSLGIIVDLDVRMGAWNSPIVTIVTLDNGKKVSAENLGDCSTGDILYKRWAFGDWYYFIR